ncbi:hypothetical protein VTO73DRAFT_7823 [Trametes versicolor]
MTDPARVLRDATYQYAACKKLSTYHFILRSPDSRPSQDITDNHDDIAWYRNVVGFRCREPTSKYTQYLEVSVTGQDIASFVTSFQEPELKSRAGGSKEGSCGSSIDRRITTTSVYAPSSSLQG